jgi:hypothetical protein
MIGRRVIVAFVIAAGLASTPRAYERATHRVIALGAVTASKLATEEMLLAHLGLPPLSSGATLPGSDGFERVIEELFAEGADLEDDLFPQVRVMHHFYDPVHSGAPLSPCVAICFAPKCGAPFAECHPSPDWALEDGQVIGTQDFSLNDARARLYQALTE